MFKKISWGLLASLSMVFSVVSCCSDADLKIESPLRDWIPYRAKQNLKFTGAAGDTISFAAVTREYNKKATDKACGAYEIQTLETTFTSPTDSTFKTMLSVSHQIVVSIKAFNQKYQVTSLDVKYNTVSDQFISHDWRDKYFKELAVNGRNYKNVLYVYGNQIPGNLVFADVLFAEGFGLIGFKTFDNKWFYLIN